MHMQEIKYVISQLLQAALCGCLESFLPENDIPSRCEAQMGEENFHFISIFYATRNIFNYTQYRDKNYYARLFSFCIIGLHHCQTGLNSLLPALEKKT